MEPRRRNDNQSCRCHCDPSKKTNNTLATKAYRIISEMKNYLEVTEQDKATLRQIFKIMRADKHYSDPIVLELLNQCASQKKGVFSMMKFGGLN